jgi:hypothetical protein
MLHTCIFSRTSTPQMALKFINNYSLKVPSHTVSRSYRPVGTRLSHSHHEIVSLKKSDNLGIETVLPS